MEILPIILIVVVVILAGVGGYFAWKAEQKRREELAALASEIGWRYSPSRDWSRDADFVQFEIFRRGHSRVAFHTLEGEMEIQGRRYAGRMGDYQYKITSGSGKNRRTRTYTFSYIIVSLPFGITPPLLIRREGFFDKIAGAFGFADINFESAEFSRKYHVRSPDRKFAYDVIDARMMEFILRSDPPTIDIERGRCCVSNGSTRWTPAQYRAMHRWMGEFFDHWPQHVKVALEDGLRH